MDAVTVQGRTVVVRLPRPIERKWVTPISSSLQKLSVPPQATGVVGTLNCCAFSSYNVGILSTMFSLLDLKHVLLLLQSLITNFVSRYTLCIYVMYITSLTDYFDDRRSQFH